MSKKDKKKLSSTQEFSLNSETEKRETQDNSFFFEKPVDNASSEKTVEAEKKPSEEVKPLAEPAAEAAAENEKLEETEAEEKSEEKKTENNTEDNSAKKENAEKKVKDKPAKKEKPEKTEKKETDGNSAFAYFFKIAGVLTLICSFVALMLASVNMLTKETIAENEKKEKTAAVTQIFTEADDAFPYEEYTGEEEIYIATKGGSFYGYCVSVISQGYGGEISMIVGIRYDGIVQGVKIISMSETAGLGSKTKNDSFLGQYANKTGPFTVGENVDGVAGATISSKAVTAGVNMALEADVTPATIAAQRGISIYGEESSEEETTAETEKAPETTANVGVPEIETEEREGTHIDPAAVGQYQSKYYYENDKSYTANRENGHYLEKETTDTESEEVTDSDTAV
ncbi:MAG: FMN-binding protein [Ruminococcaceae bacterium]|nr:FMN-binding protein [Oscillospiraceae bacterium]